MRVIEALVTDPEMRAAFYNTGVEGVHYTIENGQAVATEKAANSGYSIKYNYLTDSFIPDFSSLAYQPDEKTKETLEGYEKGQVSELGAVNVMTGIYTGRSPKDKFIVVDENSKDTVWWTSDEYKNDNHPATQHGRL